MGDDDLCHQPHAGRVLGRSRLQLVWRVVMRETREGGCAIAVMAKAPRPGQVKTRLVPPLSASAASMLSVSFLRDITENITLAARDAAIQGYIAFAPAGAANLFDGMLAA